IKFEMMKNLLLPSCLFFLLTFSAAAAAQTQLGLDPTFGNGNGYVITSDGSEYGNGEFTGLAIQPDGKILAIGYLGIARYNPDGTLDNTFGNSGINNQIRGDSYKSYLTILNDGSILLSENIGSARITKLKSNGGKDLL